MPIKDRLVSIENKCPKGSHHMTVSELRGAINPNVSLEFGKNDNCISSVHSS